jgi:hypothetical protein
MMPHSDKKDLIQVEIEAEELTSKVEFSLSGGPKITGSIQVNAKTLKLMVVGFCIIATLAFATIGTLAYIMAGS